MIFGDVKDRRRGRPQAGGGFQLEAGKLQDIEFALSIQQHQRRQANIAPDANVQPRRFRHFSHKGSHGAFTVGTGDRNNRRLRLAAEQFNIADNFYPRIRRGAQGRMRQRDARAGDNQVRRQQPVFVQTADIALNGFRQLVQPRRRNAGIHHPRRHAASHEKVHA